MARFHINQDTYDDDAPILQRFQSRVPSPSGHVETRVVVPLAGSVVVARVEESKRVDEGELVRTDRTEAEKGAYLIAFPPS